ncbi:hypothetical protein BDW02DRAFT_536161, partial [Decorospora gaudefroyi]
MATQPTALLQKRTKSGRAIATKKPRQNVIINTANVTSRPWLTRMQNISEEDVFIIHCRDNLVPGSTGVKDWDAVAEEFNKRFRGGGKKTLAGATMSRRCGIARKRFLVDNPEYRAALVYTVPVQMDEENKSEQSGKEVVEPSAENGFRDATDEVEDGGVDLTSIVHGEAFNALPMRQHEILSRSPTRLPGYYDPSAIPEQISPITRAKFHLRHRTDEPITFRFPDTHEENLSRDDPQFADADTLIAVSPFYARMAREDPQDTAIEVPKHISIRTVNIFVQIISPEPTTQLPSHYLWKSRRQVPGTYDRFGAIEVEKIIWTVDALFDLLWFSSHMEVFWVVDMVIDRLHWMYTEQNQLRDIFHKMPTEHFIANDQNHAPQLPTVDHVQASLTAEDFVEHIERVVAHPLDIPTLRFVADVLHALGAEPHEYLITTSPSLEARDIFARADAKSLDITTRDKFCVRYHHHDSSDSCYTSHHAYPPSYFINRLYATSSSQELFALSDGLLSASSLTNLLYSSDDNTKLKKDNSSTEMLDGEKMVLEMETRLELAKDALRMARDAGEAGKTNAIAEARKVVEGMYG